MIAQKQLPPVVWFALLLIIVFGTMLVLVFTGVFDVPEEEGEIEGGVRPGSRDGGQEKPGTKEGAPPPESTAEALERGRAAEEQGDWQAAMAAFEAALKFAPGNAEAQEGIRRLDEQHARKLPGKPGEAFMLPIGGTDMHGNPVVVRDNKPADPDTGLAYEIWLREVRMELVLIPAGEFRMGSPSTEAGRGGEEEPAHTVRIRKRFYMGKYEVTQAQWEKVMGTKPSHFPGADRPVDNVLWSECRKFVEKLNSTTKAPLQGCRFRLPSEAEWEYAARAGTRTRYASGDHEEDLDRVGWYKANTGKNHYRPVGSKSPNPWGLYDMHGNVWEWCEDIWHDNYKGAPQNGSAWTTGRGGRVMRGGSWDYEPQQCRSASRSRGESTYQSKNTGFRVVLSVPQR
ncbi:MAG: formylglycine-generating enzyme family protein [Planctomycetota bacterium]